MKKIDVHVHTHEYDGAQIKKIVGGKPDDYATPVELKAMYEKLGVDKAVLLPELFPECGYSMVSNETIQEIAEKYVESYSTKFPALSCKVKLTKNRRITALRMTYKS